MKTDITKQHLIRYAGTTYCQDCEGVCRIVYGCLRDVYADQTCNYSYREFWF